MLCRPALLACFGATIALATPACAQDAASHDATNRWGGFYIGTNVGGGSGRLEGTTQDLSGALAGGYIGYNWQGSNVVLGVEGDLDWTGYDLQVTSLLSGGQLTVTAKHDYLASVRGRLGFTNGPALFYGTAGVAFTDIDISAAVTGPGINIENATTTSVSGVIGGLGLEYAFSPNLSLRGEALWFDLHPDFDFSKDGYSGNEFRAGLTYSFR